MGEVGIDGSGDFMDLDPMRTEGSLDDGVEEETASAGENRTRTERYNKNGRGPQMCNKCGKPRKGHVCEFMQVSRTVYKTRLERALKLGFLLGVNRERANFKANQGEGCGICSCGANPDPDEESCSKTSVIEEV